jgi:hypothetical protein
MRSCVLIVRHDMLLCLPSQDMHVGILRPDWLEGSTYLGQEQVDGQLTYKWSKDSSVHKPFITYWASVETSDPVRWIFFDNGTFDMVSSRPMIC